MHLNLTVILKLKLIWHFSTISCYLLVYIDKDKVYQ